MRCLNSNTLLFCSTLDLNSISIHSGLLFMTRVICTHRSVLINFSQLRVTGLFHICYQSLCMNSGCLLFLKTMRCSWEVESVKMTVILSLTQFKVMFYIGSLRAKRLIDIPDLMHLSYSGAHSAGSECCCWSSCSSKALLIHQRLHLCTWDILSIRAIAKGYLPSLVCQVQDLYSEY